jgi:integrase
MEEKSPAKKGSNGTVPVIAVPQPVVSATSSGEAKRMRTNKQLEKIGEEPNQKWRARWQYYSMVDGQKKRRHKEKILGLVAGLSEDEANARLDALIEESGSKEHVLTLGRFIETLVMPLKKEEWRRKWYSVVCSLIKVHFRDTPIYEKPLTEVLPSDCKLFLISMAKKLVRKRDGSTRPISESMVRHGRKFLKQVFGFAVEERFLLAHLDPTIRLKMPNGATPPEETPLVDWEKITLALAITSSDSNKRDYLILQCGFGLGLRPHETFALRVNDVQPGMLVIDEGVVEGLIGEVKTVESKKPIPLPADLESEFMDYIEKANLKSDDFLFSCRSGKPMSQNNYVQRQLKAIGKKIGVADLNFRMQRTGYGSHAAQFGKTPKDLQRNLRHASAVFSQTVYQKPLSQTVVAMQDGYHDLIRKSLAQHKTG